MRRALLLLIGLTIGAVSWPSAQQPPQQHSPAGASGFISGRVVDAASGKPVPDATVLLNGRSAAMQQQAQAGGGRGAAPAPPPPPPAVLTDSQGRFFFSSLAPGMYTTQV